MKELEKPRILVGNSLETLKEIESGSVDTCVTSPPYWGLRDYGTEEQLGLEETPEEYVNNLVTLFREVKRVLKDDGTLWLNLGDSYAGNNSRASNNGRAGFGNPREKVVSRTGNGLKQKDLVGIPWRVAFALQADGWYLRQDIIWHKPNPMPESVTDRCTKAHEYIFLLSKSKNYYYDYKAIREPASYDGRKDTKLKGSQKYADSNIIPGQSEHSFASREHERWKEDENGLKVKNKRSVWTVPAKHGKYKTQENESLHRQGIHANRGENLIEVRSKLPKQKDLVEFLRFKTKAKVLAENTDIPLTKIEHWFRSDESGFAYPSINDWKKVREYIDDWSEEFYAIDEGLTYYELKTDEVVLTDKRNKRSVWTVPTKAYPGSHFAVFPPELIKPCILAGSRQAGIVLDPFAGSGTTGQVAIENNRNVILCELNEEYAKLIHERLNSTTIGLGL